MRCPSQLSAGVLAASLFAMGGYAQAAILLDNFTDTTAAWPATVNSLVSASRTEDGLSGVAGSGHREITLSASAVNIPGLDEIHCSIFSAAPHVLDYNATAGAAGTLTLVEGSAATHPMNLNLTGQDHIQISLSHDAANGQPLIILPSIIANGSATPLPAVFVPTAGFQNVSISLAALSPSMIGDVDQISLTFSPPTGGDFRVFSVSAVPEPGSLSLLGLGAAALLRRRRR